MNALAQAIDDLFAYGRYYGGAEFADAIEALAIRRATYGVSRETELIDLDEIRDLALRKRPKLIIVGGSAYPRAIDFGSFRAIADEVDAYLMVDMAHFAGLVATGLYPNPFPHADVVTTTTYKSLRGARGGLVLWNDEALSKKINSGIFPGVQGSVMLHAVAGKAACLGEALRPEFKAYNHAVLENARALASALSDAGMRIVAGGTDTGLIDRVLQDPSDRQVIAGFARRFLRLCKSYPVY
jgi:glycine hydroxymethyltransferase